MTRAEDGIELWERSETDAARLGSDGCGLGAGLGHARFVVDSRLFVPAIEQEDAGLCKCEGCYGCILMATGTSCRSTLRL